MEEKNDLRITKTRRAIRKAFLELMNEQSFIKITVKDIIDRAEINRSTFYAHYLDKYDLLDQIENELLAGFYGNGSTIYGDFIQASSSKEQITRSIAKRANYLKENGKLLALLFSEKGDPTFIRKLSDTIKMLYIDQHMDNVFIVPQNYVIAALLGTLSNLLAEWAKGGFKEAPDEFAQIAYKIIMLLPAGLIS